MEYKIIQHPDQSFMQETVNREIKDGWTPMGGISYKRQGGYMQAMVKE